MGKAKAEIEITASSSRLGAGLDAAARRFQGFAGSVARGTSASFRAMRDGLAKLKPGQMSTAMGTFAGGMMTRVADQMMEAGRGVLDFNRNLVRFQVTGNLTKAETEQFGESIRQISKDTAISSDQVLAAASAYVAFTGDVDGAKTAAASFARIAQATGTSTADVAKAAGAMKKSLKIDPADFEKAFSVLASQGKSGSVELNEFATELAGIAPSFAQFGKMDGLEGIGELGAALQTIRNGFGSTSEAANGFRGMLVALQEHADKFQAAGVRVFDVDKGGTKTMRNFSDIWHDINKSKLVKDPTLLTKAFGREDAKRAYDQFKLMPDEFDKMIAKAHDYGTVAKDFDTIMSSPAGRIDAAWNRAKEAMAEVFTTDRLETFAKAVEGISSALERMIDLMGEAKDFWSGENFEQTNPFEKHDTRWDKTKVAALGTFMNQRLETATANPDSDMYISKERDIRSRSTRAERIKEAVQATLVKGDAGGGAGLREAGEQYLKEKHVGLEERYHVRDQLLEERANPKLAHEQENASTPLLQQLIRLTQQLPAAIGREVGSKIPAPVSPLSNNDVNRQARNATDHRRG